MMTLHPFTAKDEQEKARRDRASHVNLAGIQMERLWHNFDRTKKVEHNLFHRLVQSLLKIGAHIPMTVEHAESLEKKMRGAATEDTQMVHIDGNRIYIEGYYDLNKLRQELLW
jgi:hypothetical protein